MGTETRIEHKMAISKNDQISEKKTMDYSPWFFFKIDQKIKS